LQLQAPYAQLVARASIHVPDIVALLAATPPLFPILNG